MSKKILFTLLVVCLAFVMGLTVGARMTTPDGAAIDRDVIGGGGGMSTDGNGNVLYSTNWQNVAGISTAGNGTILVSGFHTMKLRGPTAARNWRMY
jgi:hypothetical protein